MSALAKAKDAIEAAKSIDDGRHVQEYLLLLNIANIQATVSIAESLERIADKYAPVKTERHGPGEAGYV